VPRLRSVPTVIARCGELIVERDPSRPSGRLLRDGGMDASYVDLADPSHLEFDYVRWMRIMLSAARARRVLHVGGGACTLARALAAADPDGRQEVCEIDPGVLAIARRHLGLRRAPGLRVHQADGRAFIAGRRDGAWDAVVIDAYVGAAVPRRLVTVEALADVRRVAALAVVNVVDNRAGQVVRRVAAGLADVYPRVWTLGGRGGNTIVVGAVADLDLARIAAAAAADPSPARLTPPAELASRLATVAPFRDEEA
jgi:protein-L-isoaspartate O-methyltransferase